MFRHLSLFVWSVTWDRSSFMIVSVCPCWQAYISFVQPPFKRCSDDFLSADFKGLLLTLTSCNGANFNWYFSLDSIDCQPTTPPTYLINYSFKKHSFTLSRCFYCTRYIILYYILFLSIDQLSPWCCRVSHIESFIATNFSSLT